MLEQLIFARKCLDGGRTTLSKQAQKLIMASGSGFFCFKICDEIDHVTGVIFVIGETMYDRG